MPAHFETADVRRAAEGDHAAFERIYRDHVGRVFSICARMVDEQSAEDLTQEVFIRVWRKLDSFKGQSQFGTWLHRLTVNHVLSRRETQRKREARHANDGALARVMAPSRRSSGHALDLDRAIPRLPARAREVFVLYDVEGYSHEEISGLLGISNGTSKSQLHRARMLLRKHLDQ